MYYYVLLSKAGQTQPARCLAQSEKAKGGNTVEPFWEVLHSIVDIDNKEEREKERHPFTMSVLVMALLYCNSLIKF